MANTDNKCSGLQIENLHKDFTYNGSDTLGDLYSLQKDIQEKVYGYDFEFMRSQPLSVMKEFFMWNTHAQADEAHEAMDALGGIHDGIGSAVWKPWKKDHSRTYGLNEETLEKGLTFNDHSERDKMELKMELIDELHFLFNKMHAVGMTTEELFNFYFAKNKENRERQKRGY